MDGTTATQSEIAPVETGIAWRRIWLAFVIGLVSGIAVLIRHRSQLHPTPLEMVSYAFAAGLVAMVTAGILQLSKLLWSKGLAGSIAAILLFGVGSITAISLICFASVVAFGV